MNKINNNLVSSVNDVNDASDSDTNDAVLVFPDGELFYGFGIGKKGKTTFGEICFNTGMTGYQETLSDPSYSGQIIIFTFPHIGNVGVNDDDIESVNPQISGLVIRENITNPANYRSNCHLNDWLIKHNITGIAGIDTRRITKIVRSKGAKTVAIIYKDNIKNIDIKPIIKKLKQTPDLIGVELASAAAVGKQYKWSSQGNWNYDNDAYNKISNQKYKVIAIDYGAKLNILRCLTQMGCDVTIVPATTTIQDILKHNPDGIFLSNGPGDPLATGKYAIPVLKILLTKNIPIFGICLGHQLLALACGAKTVKMQQGHRGSNHPVQNLKTQRVEITSQNHGFVVDTQTLPDSLEITHISLFDKSIEGIKVKGKKAFSVQHHPESSPGPADSYYLFREFIKMMEEDYTPNP